MIVSVHIVHHTQKYITTLRQIIERFQLSRNIKQVGKGTISPQANIESFTGNSIELDYFILMFHESVEMYITALH